MTRLSLVSEAKSDMTDGCGLSSKSVHHILSHLLRLPSTPTAFQFRLAGYKVTWQLYGILVHRFDAQHLGHVVITK